MYKYILLLLLLSSNCLLAQETEERKNRIELGLSKMFFTYGDYVGTHFYAGWNHQIRRRFGFSLEAGVARAEKRSDLLALYPIADKYPPTIDNPVILEPNEQAGIIDYSYNHHDQQTATIGSALLKYNAIYTKRSKLGIGFGPSITYVNNTYISLGITGDFHPTFSSDTAKIYLNIPIYERFMDVGFQGQVEYQYKPIKNISVGIRAVMNDYFSTGYLLWSAGIVTGFEF